MSRFLWVAMFLVGVLCTHSVSAQVASDTFTVKVFGGADTEAPTTPSFISVVPISQNQIDLQWTVAVDNFIVSGYSLLRDGTAIATTTLTTFSDTGLVASTTYQYQVRAFDATFNYSSTSAAVSTTTLPAPVIPPVIPPVVGSTTPANSGTAVRAVIDEFSVSVTESSATMMLLTAKPTQIELRWGRTGSYELGYITTDIFRTQHTLQITDLEPNTTYEYQLIGYTPQGVKTSLQTGQFTTAAGDQIERPANVARFSAVGDKNDVVLRWDFFELQPGMYVRVVRSHLGFPQHPQDGAIVYQGTDRGVRDQGVLARYSPVYYTAFVYAADGMVSSGAVAIVYASNNQSGNEGSAPAVTIPDLPEEVSTGLPIQIIDPAVDVSKMILPGLEDVLITQASTVFLMNNPRIVLDANQPFAVKLPIEVVSFNLKSIVVTLLDPSDNRRHYSFLLRLNNDQTAYEALIAPLELVGQSQITVEIFDYQANIVSTYKTALAFTDIPEDGSAVRFPDALFQPSVVLPVTGSLSLACMLLLIFIYRHRGEDKK